MQAKKLIVFTLLLFLLVSLISLLVNPLINDDATMYAVTIRNTVLYNQWLAPLISPGDISSFLDKPPLGIWILSIMPKLLGVSVFSVHLSNVLIYIILLGVLYVFLIKSGYNRIALNTVIISSTSMVMILFARTPKLDILIAFTIMMSHLFIFRYLKTKGIKYLYLFTLSVAIGVLIKSGFALIMPGLTILMLIILNKSVRDLFVKFLMSRYFYLCLLLLVSVVSAILAIQWFAFNSIYFRYLESIFIQSKYNTSYMGFGLNLSVIGFMLVAIFPWTPLFLSNLKLKFKYTGSLSFYSFCQAWFLSNFLFFMFFFKQTDIRTFTILVVPMSILSAYKLCSIDLIKKKRLVEIVWTIVFVFLFILLIVSIISNPINASGFDQRILIFTLGLFVIAEGILFVYLLKPSMYKFILLFAFICLSYTALFIQAPTIANQFNPYVEWPALVSQYKLDNYSFVIYRPSGRNLHMSSDLCFVDFMVGPADQYVWEQSTLLRLIEEGGVIVLSDTKSFQKLNINNWNVIAKDKHDSVILISKKKNK